MSAHDIPRSSLSLAFAVTGGLAWLAGGRRRGVYAIGGGLVAVQAALHLIFSTGGAHDTGTGGTMAHGAMSHGDMAGSAMGAATMEAPNMAGSAMGHAATEPVMRMVTGHTSVGMLAAHLLAALVCGLWLARGEAALFGLARAVGGALALTPLRLLLAVARLRVRVPELPHPVRPRPHTRRLLGVVLAHTLSRRGPPRLSTPRATALGAHV
ncbi:hypothetical protein ACF06X_03780 [Streptomyces sp. NPDC015346]|uniref:hypothetical protein n=1 Tax=Streptomyces sp. NPDC015346 TaxID=3364954 RepID=UPI0036F5B009